MRAIAQCAPHFISLIIYDTIIKMSYQQLILRLKSELQRTKREKESAIECVDSTNKLVDKLRKELAVIKEENLSQKKLIDQSFDLIKSHEEQLVITYTDIMSSIDLPENHRVVFLCSLEQSLGDYINNNNISILIKGSKTCQLSNDEIELMTISGAEESIE